MTYESTEKFIRIFQEKNGSIICDRLTGIQMADKAQHDKAMQDGTFEKICLGYVKDAVKIVLDLIKE